jgi:hypothetical protein
MVSWRYSSGSSCESQCLQYNPVDFHPSFGCYKDVVMGQDKENMERVRGKSLAGNPINVIKSCSGSSGSCTQP